MHRQRYVLYHTCLMSQQASSHHTLRTMDVRKKKFFQVHYIELHNFSVIFHQLKDVRAIKCSPLSVTCCFSLKYSFDLFEHFQSELVFLCVKDDRRLRKQNFKHLVLNCFSIKDTVLITCSKFLALILLSKPVKQLSTHFRCM